MCRSREWRLNGLDPASSLPSVKKVGRNLGPTRLDPFLICDQSFDNQLANNSCE